MHLFTFPLKTTVCVVDAEEWQRKLEAELQALRGSSLENKSAFLEFTKVISSPLFQLPTTRAVYAEVPLFKKPVSLASTVSQGILVTGVRLASRNTFPAGGAGEGGAELEGVLKAFDSELSKPSFRRFLYTESQAVSTPGWVSCLTPSPCC